MKIFLVKKGSYNKIFKISLLFLVFSQNHQIKSLNNDQLLLGAATFLTGGACLYAYHAYYNSMYHHQKVYDDIYNIFYNAQNYIAHIQILKKQFNLETMSDFEKRVAVGKITEDLAWDLSWPVNSSGVDNYLSNLSFTIDNLKKKLNLLERTVQKLKAKNSSEGIYNNSFNLEISIKELLPNLEFLKLYVSTHKSYFKMVEVGNRIAKEFAKDMEVLMSNIEPNLSTDLIKHVRAKYFDKNISYPLLKYVELVSKNVKEINDNLSRLTFKYPRLIENAEKLRTRLNTIINYIVVEESYVNEKRRFEEDRERQEKIRADQAFKAKQLNLEKQKMVQEQLLREREIAARERQADAKAREARAKELEVLARLQADRSAHPAVPPAVHVHVRN